jgi:hypothetical protein
MKDFFRGRFILLFLLALCSAADPVLSCSTPVFRYALERWPAYLYEVEVLHTGTLTPAEKHAFDLLKSYADSGESINLRLIEKQVESPDEEISELRLPAIRLYFPKEHNMPEPFWQGALNEENVRRLVDSPARRDALRKIQNGDAVVWFFLGSGDRGVDSDRAILLAKQLRILSQELKLATFATDAKGQILDIDTLERDVDFSMVKVSLDDPDEEIFIKMLKGTESDLSSFSSPMAFPVFGRGRALYALVGMGINQKLIRKACNSIIGWCSCTVKEDNPGVDLLFRADWESAVGDSSWIQTETLPEITGLSQFLPAVADTAQEIDLDYKDHQNNSNGIDYDKKTDQTDETVKSPEVLNTSEVEVLVIEDNPHVEVELEKPPIKAEESNVSVLTRNLVIIVGLIMLVIPLVAYFLRKSFQR